MELLKWNNSIGIHIRPSSGKIYSLVLTFWLIIITLIQYVGAFQLGANETNSDVIARLLWVISVSLHNKRTDSESDPIYCWLSPVSSYCVTTVMFQPSECHRIMKRRFNAWKCHHRDPISQTARQRQSQSDFFLPRPADVTAGRLL